jgi:hypothetical protein
MEMKRRESNSGGFFEGEASLAANTPLNSDTRVAQ